MSEERTRIVLVRHGKTAWNRAPERGVRFRGRADLALDDVGRRQAAATARYVMKRWPVEAVYASPMARAMETAGAIAKAHDINAEAFDGLLDIDFGDWQGLSLKAVREQYPDLLREWFEAPHTVQVPGGESLDDVRRRVVAGLDTIVERDWGETVAMVGHSVVNRVLLCAVLGLGNEHFWRLRQDTCGVNVFDTDEGGSSTIVVLNDTCHLQSIE
jgi:broad specificity phosphatase PhoE